MTIETVVRSIGQRRLLMWVMCRTEEGLLVRGDGMMASSGALGDDVQG